MEASYPLCHNVPARSKKCLWMTKLDLYSISHKRAGASNIMILSTNESGKHWLQADTRMRYPGQKGIKTVNDIYNRNICVAARGEWKKGDPEASFEDFVKYLIKTKVEHYDGHWQLITRVCR